MAQTELFQSVPAGTDVPSPGGDTAPESASVAADAGAVSTRVWKSTDTGLVVPGATLETRHEDSRDGHRGDSVIVREAAVLVVPLSDEKLADLQESSDRRGYQDFNVPGKRPARTAQEKAVLNASCAWMAEHEMDVFGVVTFAPKYAEKRALYTFGRALDDVAAGFKEVDFGGKFALAAEWHRTAREVPHVHLVLRSGTESEHGMKRLTDKLYAYFFNTRGRSRFEPMRDLDDASFYSLKDTFKNSAQHANASRYFLSNYQTKHSKQSTADELKSLDLPATPEGLQQHFNNRHQR
jgi:hypothetical protein